MRILISLLLLTLLSCAYTNKVNNGQVAYDSKKYSIAVELLQKEYLNSDENDIKAARAYMLGKSYQFLNDNKKALRWFDKAVEHKYGPVAIREKAFALKRDQQYVEAIKAFEELERVTGKDFSITREINICRQALNWLEPKENLDIEIFPFAANSDFSDYSPTFFKEDHIVFSSDRTMDTDGKVYDWTGNGFSDIYVLNKNTNEVLVFDPMINTASNEATAIFNKDFTQIYFTRCDTDLPGQEDEYCRIFQSELQEDDTWTEPLALPFQEAKRNYGHPALLQLDSVLIYTVKVDDGSETYDLYYSVLEGEGWINTFPMPESINTDGNEKFPTSDRDTLYFSSDYLPGLGGLDLFKTYLRSDNSWSPPQNMKAPFNSGADDFGLSIDRSSENMSDVLYKGYFTTTRNGETNDDILGFEVRNKIKKLEVEKEDEIEEEKEFKVFIAGRVVLNKYQIENNPSSPLIGKDPMQGVSVTMGSREEQYSFITDTKGRFIQEVSKNQEYTIDARMKDFLGSQTSVSTENLSVAESENAVTINVELALEKIEYGKEILLENIYYDFDKWNIREDAKPSLNRLADLLANNPSILIELASHTDCKGNDAYNQNLSQKRAQSAVNYIVSKGISKNRMMARGYGETALQERCECNDCTDVQNQINRRTTFKMIKGE